MTRRTNLPLVRLSLVAPIVRELESRGVDSAAVLASNGLARDSVEDPDVFVPPIVVHRFLEDAALAAGDPHLCQRAGEALDTSDWPPFVDAVSNAKTLGDFLVRFIRAASLEASSAQHSLEVGPRDAVFREIRTSEQEIAPAQNDAFTAAYTLGLLRRGSRELWRPDDVWLTVCDPDALPDRYLGVHVVAGDRLGMKVRFPSEWVVHDLEPQALLSGMAGASASSTVPSDFAESLRQALGPHLHRDDLGVDYVVELLGVSRRKLRQNLRRIGTTLSDEIRALRERRAASELRQSHRSIAEVARSVGYRDPTSFARAFKSWTGSSPRDFRKNASNE